MVDHFIIIILHLYVLSVTTVCLMATVTGYDLLYCCIWGTEIAFEKSCTLPVSFTSSYTEDKPNFPWQNNRISQKICSVNKVLNFKDFWRPNKEIKYFSRTLTEFKNFSIRLLQFKTFSRLYEPCSKEQMWQCQVLKIRSQKTEEYSAFYSTYSQKGLCIWEAFLLLFCIPEMFFSHTMRVRSVLIWMSGKTLKVITTSFEAQTFLFFLSVLLRFLIHLSS